MQETAGKVIVGGGLKTGAKEATALISQRRGSHISRRIWLDTVRGSLKSWAGLWPCSHRDSHPEAGDALLQDS